MICDLALDTNNGPVNICSGVPTSLKDLAFKIAKKYSNEHLLVFGANQDNQILPLNIWGIPYQKSKDDNAIRRRSTKKNRRSIKK